MSAPRAAVARAFEEALASIDLGARVRNALPWELARLAASVGTPSFRRVRVFACGKAAPSMLAGALARLEGRAVAALCVAPDGVPLGALGLRGTPSGADAAASGADARLRVLRASHPLPDARSVEAARAALAFVRARGGDAVVALISGGTSSLLCAPRAGMDLEEKRARVDALLRGGRDIRAVNAARTALSRVKGGGLARAAAPRPVLTLVASDVLGGFARDVGSGPTLPAPGMRASRRCRACIVASPATLARAIAERLATAGFAVRVLPPSGADVACAAMELAALAAQLPSGAALVRAAEPTIVLPPGGGAGGRACHLAALVAPRLPPDVAFLAGASDGVDGASGTAGACVDDGLDPTHAAAALAAFATGDLHRASGTALPLAPTGLNLADVHVLARA